jgi:uncharacterized protein
MKRFLFSFLVMLGLSGSPYAQYPFTPVDTSFTTQNVIFPAGYSFTTLFFEGDDVFKNNGQFGPARGTHDFLIYVPNSGSSSNGWLFVNHETANNSNLFGDGGGVTTFALNKTSGTWVAQFPFKHMEFSHLGGTRTNCAGGNGIMANGNVLTVEEFPPNSNAELYNNGNGIRDTSDYGGYKKYLNYGWMVECNVQGDTAIRKMYQMGRYSHEAAQVMPDGRTVYLTDDFTGGAFFKFVANTFGNYETGQLFAYKQIGNSGTWLPMPMSRDSLNIARDVAQRMGATVFNRMEDIDIDASGNLYIAETGADSANFSTAVNNGGVVAPHLIPLSVGNNRYDDPYGRILKFDPNLNSMTVYLQGGNGSDGKTNFASVDNVQIDRGRNLIYLQEDLIAIGRNRNPSHITSSNQIICEIYALNLSVQNPTVNDIKRFAVFPRGAEATGGYFTPDNMSFFVNVQHPNSSNAPPFNKSVTIAVTGFPPLTGVNGQEGLTPKEFKLSQNYPNPFNPSTVIKFSVPKDGNVSIKVYDIKGQLIKTLVNQNIIVGNYSVDFDGTGLASGVYLYSIETPEYKDTKKMILVK